MRSLALAALAFALACAPPATGGEDGETLPYEPFNGGVATGGEGQGEGETEPSATGDDAGCATNAAEERLACRFAARARRAMADADVRVVGADLVRVDDHELAMDALRATCERDPSSCERRMDDWLAALAEAREAETTPARAEQLRPVLKHADFVTAIRRDDPALADLTRPFVGDVHVLLVVDFPRLTRGLDRRDLAALAMTADEAHAQALANLREHHGDLPVEPMPNGLKAMGPTDGYAAARLLLHEEWARVAETNDADLVVAPCNRDLVILGSSEQLEPLLEASIRAYRYVDHPITRALWRWTPEGWVTLETEGEAHSDQST